MTRLDDHQKPIDALETAVLSLKGRILAIGDIMLDVFTYGQCTRVSPEAPIPVLHVTHETRMLGGVGNVARNVSALGGSTFLVAPVGADSGGATIEELILVEPLIESRLIRCQNRETTTKRRLIAASQQMLRVDLEQTKPLEAVEDEAFFEQIALVLSSATAVVISDYGKGALSPALMRRLIDAARAAGKIVLVDPKNRDMTRYAGATCITPNARELADATGLPVDTDAEVAAAAQVMLAATGVQYVLATRSEKGMSLVGRDDYVLHLPSHKREVYDVSGAGDTVIATVALAVGAGIPWPVAANLANIAAGVVVGKPGTATCSIDELELEITDMTLGLHRKLVSAPHAVRLATQWRRAGLEVGFTNGCFDLLHPGHVALLQRARQTCDRLVVGLNSDDSVKRLKGPMRPLQSQAARAIVLAALAAVDLIVVFDEDTPLDLIRTLRPTVLLKGADYSMETVVGADCVIADGGQVKLIDLVEGQSTTKIISRMQ